MRFRFAPRRSLAVVALSAASLSAAFAGGTEYTDIAAYQKAATTAGMVTFNGAAPPVDLIRLPWYTEGNASIHSYYQANGQLGDVGFVYDPILTTANFDGTDFYYSFAGMGPDYGVPDGHGYLEITFAPGQKHTAGGIELGSVYAGFGPVNDFTATLAFYDGPTLLFTTASHSFPDFYGRSPHYGYLGAVTDAPFDRILLETTPGAQAAWWVGDNIRYGSVIAPVAAVPEPGIVPFAVVASGVVGGLALRRRRG